MPETEVLFYCDANGSAPVLEWLDELRRKDRRAFKKCEAAIGMLATFGHELRRPLADILENGIYELRARFGKVNYRILFFYHGRNVAVLAHGLTKERAVPPTMLNQAIERKKQFEAAPDTHTYRE